MPIYWLDGNHEDFDHLLSEKGIVGQDEEGFDKLGPVWRNAEPHELNMLHHIPRGHVWNWDGKRFMGFGGAPSIDKNMRIPGVSWFPQELPSYSEVNQALYNDPVNVLFTHDSPLSTFGMGMPTHGYKDDPISVGNREAIAAITEQVQPQHLFHGHYHWNHETDFPHANGVTHVHGLNMDDTGSNSYHLLDTEEL